jgi:threonine dehydratase
MNSVTLKDIKKAQSVLEKILEPTPLVRNAWLSEAFGCDLFLKLETFQPVGSFKIRGATYKISQLTESEKKCGVIAASAGNHAQGVAWGSRHFGVNALIVMPKNAPIVKIQNTKMLGAQVRLEGDTYDEAYACARGIAQETGRVYIHAFEDPHVIAGQGTIGLELSSQSNHLDYVISSIGGGGLLAGIAIALKTLRPDTKLIGCQASGAASMVRSIEQGHAVSLDSVNTFADGIKVKNASEVMRKILAAHVDEFHLADDESMAAAILALAEKAKILSEGAGALPLAVLDGIREQIYGKKVALIIGGGNIDVNVLSRIVDRGLTRAGRRLRVNVLISDRPGSLAQLTQLLAEQGANIIQAIHDRNEPSVMIDQTEVELTLETRGPEHSLEVVEALKKNVIRVVFGE